MQLTQTLSEGLKREFKVVLPVAELENRLTEELNNVKGRIRLNGFRPGKVPAAHIRRLYGRSIVGDLIEKTVSEANQRIINENNIRLAQQPKVNFPEDKDDVEKILDVKKDLEFAVSFEVLPNFDIVDISDVAITREVTEVSDDLVQETINNFAKYQREFEEKSSAAEKEDKVVVDFVGTIDGEKFEGGSGEGIQVEIGSNSFIPGFEDQLIGLKAGDEKVIKVTFPENYMSEKLAGKPAKFAVTVKSVLAPKELQIDDELAKKLGSENLEKLTESVQNFLKDDLAAQSRRRAKKRLLDALDERYSFDLPEVLVNQEFEGIWNQIQADLKSSNKTFEDEGTTEERAREEYRKIAERRVRLGLVLAEIGEKSEVKVTDDEVTQELIKRVQMYPGQERQMWDFYKNNPSALAEIRAPLFEEKVVDQLLTQVKITDTPVSREELYKDDEEAEI